MSGIDDMEPGMAKEALLSAKTVAESQLLLQSQNYRASPTCPHCGEALYSKMTEYAGLEFHTAENLTVVIRSEPRQVLRMTNSESTLLAVLAHAKGRVVSKDRLYDGMYWRRAGDGPDSKIVDVVVCKLRKKLLHYQLPITIETWWGRGYQLQIVK